LYLESQALKIRLSAQFVVLFVYRPVIRCTIRLSAQFVVLFVYPRNSLYYESSTI